MTIQMNKDLSIDELASSFSENGIVRISSFLQDESAAKIRDFLQQNVDYQNAFFVDGSNREASDKEISDLPFDTRQQLYRGIHQSAAKGVGFLYGKHQILDESPEYLKNTLSFLNTTKILELVSSITQNINLNYADGQATRYRSGDFLTRHTDNIPGETRQIAYVLGMTENWHPDWGGLLQFFQQNGEPTNSWSPEYNSLTLFDVKKIHSVTSIAPFTERNRYSITGWYRK